MTEKNIVSKTTFSPSLLLIAGSCLCTLMQLAALPYNVSWMVSLSNRILMVLWFVVVGFVLIHRFSKPIFGDVASILLVVLFSMAAWFLAASDSPGNAMDYLMKTIGFLIFPIMLCYSAFFKIDEKAKTAVCLFAIICSLLFIWLYHSDKCYVYRGPYGIVQLDNVTLGYPNPNQTAMYLFLCAVMLFSGMFYFQSAILKLLIAIDCGYIVWILHQTGSRTAILLFVVFAVFSIIFRKKDIPKYFVGLSLVIPLLYVILVPFLSNSQQTITFMGEDILTGRDQIYDRYFQNLNIISFIFGNMNLFKFDNLHNGYVAVAASVGVIACVSYVACIRTCLKGNHPDGNAPIYARVSFVAILCMLVYTSSEAAFFVGGSNYAFLMFSPFIMFAKPFAEEATRAEGG